MKNSVRILTGIVVLMGTWSIQTTMVQAASQPRTATTTAMSTGAMDTYIVANNQLVPIESPAGHQQVQRSLLMTSPDYHSENLANFRMYVVPKGTYPINYTVDSQGKVYWGSPKRTTQLQGGRRQSRRVYSRALAAVARQRVPLTNVARTRQPAMASATKEAKTYPGSDETQTTPRVTTGTADWSTQRRSVPATGVRQSTPVPAESPTNSDTLLNNATPPTTSQNDETFMTSGTSRTPVTTAPASVNPSTDKRGARLPQTDEQSTLLIKLLGGGLLGSIGVVASWYGTRRKARSARTLISDKKY